MRRYAIVVWPGQDDEETVDTFDSYLDAIAECNELNETEPERYDVVRVLEDGSLTTEF